MGKRNLIGLEFEHFKIIGENNDKTQLSKEKQKKGEIQQYRTYYNCLCECGNVFTITNFDIVKNKSRIKSCGCMKNKLISASRTKYNEYEEFDTYYKGWDIKHENFFLISKEDYEEVSKYC